MQSEQDILAEFSRQRPSLEAFRVKICALIEELLKNARIDVVQVESRTKSSDSLEDKVARKGGKYSTLSDITDLIGVRVVAYYLEDVVEICDLLADEFTVDEADSVDKGAELGSDSFGYRSNHRIIRLKDPRIQLGEWAGFSKTHVEVQVRTALQHAWAAVNHKVEYKSTNPISSDMTRRLFRLSALFELADEQFSLVREARSSLDAENQSSVSAGQLNVPLDTSSLIAFLSESPSVREFKNRAEATGWSIAPDDYNPDRLPRDREDLLHVLEKLGIRTLQQFADRLVQQDYDRLLAELADAERSFKREPALGIEDLLTLFLIASCPDRGVARDLFFDTYTVGEWDRTREAIKRAE